MAYRAPTAYRRVPDYSAAELCQVPPCFRRTANFLLFLRAAAVRHPDDPGRLAKMRKYAAGWGAQLTVWATEEARRVKEMTLVGVANQDAAQATMAMMNWQRWQVCPTTLRHGPDAVHC